MAYRGQELVQIFRTLIGKSYESRYENFTLDCTGSVCYCLYKALGIKKDDIGTGCRQHWEYFTLKRHKGTVLYKSSSRDTHKSGMNVPTSKVKAGDLLYKFNYDNSSNHHVVMATGSGYGTIDASGGAGVVREKSSYEWAFKDVDLWVRMYEDGETTGTTVTSPSLGTEINAGSGGGTPTGSTGEVSQSPVINIFDPSTGSTSSTTSYDYSYLLAGGLPLTSVDVYKGAMTKILSEIRAGGASQISGVSVANKALGFVSDLTHGGQFKFILPEFSEEYTANYETISIPGRSSDIQSYSSTSSPSRSVSLQLMAGEGLYTGSNPIESMQKDIAFLKSLAYPDYSSSIVSPPPIVLVYLGPTSIIKGVITAVSVNYHKPYTTEGEPMYAEVSFTVVQASDDPPDYKDVRNRSTTSY